MCVSAKKKPPNCAHKAARSMIFSLVQAFTLREGWCAFGFVKYFNTKVDSCPVRSISVQAVPQASYLWFMLTFEIFDHTTGRVIDPHCQRRRELHVIPSDATTVSHPWCLSCLQRNSINWLCFFFFVCFFYTQNCCSCPKLQSDCSHVCLGCGGKSSELLPVSGHWSKQRGRVSGPIRLPHWPRHKQLPEPLLGDQHTDLEKSSTSFFSE